MNWNLLLGHWILTLLSGPIIFIIKNFATTSNPTNITGFLAIYPIFVIIGFFFSIPTYSFFSLIYVLIKNEHLKTFYEKILFIPIIVAGIFITTAFIGGTIWFDIALSYSIATTITGLFYLNYKTITNHDNNTFNH